MSKTSPADATDDSGAGLGISTPPGSSHLNLTAGVITLVGGAMGYKKAGSINSLIVGVCAGMGFLGAGYHIHIGNDYDGHATGAVTGTVLMGIMAKRFSETLKIMPAAPVAVLGLVTAMYNSQKAFDQTGVTLYEKLTADDPDGRERSV